MEYEIYYLCNILGVILIAVIVLFHFVESDDNGKNQTEEVIGKVKTN